MMFEEKCFQSRGSGDPTTGPAMDSSSDRATAGGYAFIDSSFPRRPGDTAKLISSSFPPTNSNSPMCMHFWFHMFGSGIGYLKLFLRHFRSSDNQLQEIWSLSGNAGNAWFMSQVTISSLDDFQLVFEASVGNTGMGDIAIDDISYGHGACPGKFSNTAYIAQLCQKIKHQFCLFRKIINSIFNKLILNWLFCLFLNIELENIAMINLIFFINKYKYIF